MDDDGSNSPRPWHDGITGLATTVVTPQIFETSSAIRHDPVILLPYRHITKAFHMVLPIKVPIDVGCPGSPTSAETIVLG